MNRCLFCQSELPPGARFCRACGRLQPASEAAAPASASGALTTRCPQCRQPLLADDRFCRQCGQTLNLRCPVCGEFAQETDRFCARCAHPLGQSADQAATSGAREVVSASVGASGALTARCPHCAQPLPATARFCANCGRNLSGAIALAPLTPGIGVPSAPAWPQSGALHIPSASAGPQAGAPPVPSAPAWPQSGAPGIPSAPAWPQSGAPGVPTAPGGAQGGPMHVPSAPNAPQAGTPSLPGAPAGPEGGGWPGQAGSVGRVAGRAASKTAGRSVGSKLLGTAAGKVIAAVIAVVVVAAGGTAAAVAVGHNPIATAFQQITGHGANNATPPPPPELTYIGSDGNVWDMTLPQGKPRQLTNDASITAPGANSTSYSGLAWSPDGKRLAIIRTTSTDTSPAYELLMLSPDGSLLWKQPIRQSLLSDSLAWSPDGRSIAYSEATQNDNYGPTGYDAEGALVIVDASTGSATNTLHYDAGPVGACGGGVDALTGLIWLAHNAHMGIDTFDWSPDGQKMLVAFNDADSESALVSLSSGATTSGYPEGASFQPGGHFILGSGGYNEPLELTDLAGKQVRILANSNGESGASPYANELGQATWSSDGKTIYYEYQDGIWRIKADGSGAQQIIAGTQIVNSQVTVELEPRLSPDGSRLLYLESHGVIDNTGDTNGSVTAQWYVAQADGSGAFALPHGAIGAQQYIVEAVWRPEK